MFVTTPCEDRPGRGTDAAQLSRSANGTWVLVAAIAGSSMTFIDGSAVNVALPILQHELNASSAELQWVIEGYALFLSALILLGGSLGDRLGRRKVFGAGVSIFAVASIGCGAAPNMPALIAARCIQGTGAALAMPGSLALISAAFAGAARGRAIGTWSGFSAITAAAGPVIGGWLAQSFSWRYVFVINVPIAAVVLVVLALRVGESRDPTVHGGRDPVAAVLATLGLGSLVFGLIQLQAGTTGIVGATGAIASFAGLVVIGVFVALQRRIAKPMVPPSIFRSRTFTVANVYTLLLYGALGGSLYFLPFDLINVQGYTPLAAGAALLPMIAIMFAFSRYSGGLVARIGARLPLVAGAIIAAVAFIAYAFSGIGHSYWTTFFPAAVILGIGGAAFVAPLTTTVLDAVEPEHAGLASGINNAASRTAGLLAVAILGIVLAREFDTRLPVHIAASSQITPVSSALVQRERTTVVTGQVPAQIAEPAQRALIATAIKQAYADGFQATMLAAAALAMLAAALAALTLEPRTSPSRR